MKLPDVNPLAPTNTLDDDSASGTGYTVNVVDNTNEFVALTKDPLCFVSVMGPARSGKSKWTLSIDQIFSTC